MSGSHDVFGDIRSLYVRPIPDEQLETMLQRVISEIPAYELPVRRRRRMVQRAVIVMASLSIITGIAVAAPGIIDRIFHANAPIAENVQRLREPGSQMAAADYERLAGPEGLGTLGGIELAPRSASRVLANDPGVGELALVAAVDGAGFCYVQTPPGDAPQVSSCEAVIPKTGVAVATLRLLEGSPEQVFGLAADGVERVTVITTTGATYPATLTGNAFHWLAPSGSVHSAKVRVEYPDRPPVEQPAGL
jgi:hypothetical protein